MFQINSAQKSCFKENKKLAKLRTRNRVKDKATITTRVAKSVQLWMVSVCMDAFETNIFTWDYWLFIARPYFDLFDCWLPFFRLWKIRRVWRGRYGRDFVVIIWNEWCAGRWQVFGTSAEGRRLLSPWACLAFHFFSCWFWCWTWVTIVLSWWYDLKKNNEGSADSGIRTVECTLFKIIAVQILCENNL